MPLLRATLTATATGRIYFPRHTFSEKQLKIKRVRVWSPNTDFVLVEALKESRHRLGEWSMVQRKYGIHDVQLDLDWTFEFSDAYVTSVFAENIDDVFHEEIEIE